MGVFAIVFVVRDTHSVCVSRNFAEFWIVVAVSINVRGKEDSDSWLYSVVADTFCVAHDGKKGVSNPLGRSSEFRRETRVDESVVLSSL